MICLFHDTPYHEAALHTTAQKVVPPPVLEFTIPQIAAFCATIAVVRGNFFGYHTSIEVSERNEERTMKKLLSLLLPLALALSLTACGEKSADEAAPNPANTDGDKCKRLQRHPQKQQLRLDLHPGPTEHDRHCLRRPPAGRNLPATSRLYWKCPLQCRPPISTP